MTTLSYTGETAPRRPGIATALNLLVPGLGVVYCGHARRGICVALGAWLGLLGLLAGGWLTGAFVLRPLGLVAIAWVYLQAGLAAHVRRLCRNAGRAYVLKAYNRGLAYLGMVVALGLVPGLGLVGFVRAHAGVARVDDVAMFPRLAPGDRILFDRGAFRSRRPARGELVVAVMGGAVPRVLRVIGLPGERVVHRERQILVDGQPLPRAAYAQVYLEPSLEDRAPPGPLLAALEYVPSEGLHYRVFHAEVDGPPIVGDVQLGPDEYFLAGDFRSDPHPADSRTLGPIPARRILGAPRHVIWSRHPARGILWSRIGTPVGGAPDD